MKKEIFSMAILAMSMCGAAVLSSCSSNDPEPTPPPTPEIVWTTDGGLKACNVLLFDNNVIGNGDKEFVFNGKQTLKKGTYTLKGWVYIAKGAELTIEPGTVIKGDKTTKAAIIVERGGKIIAQGKPNAPIVFTSAQPAGQRRPGDWGGIILCGNARNNQTEMQIEGGPRSMHGGKDDADNSGVLSYVRIEFAGYPFATDKEINGLTLGSVGSGTKIDHVQVSYSNDDSFEWFGGTVNCKYLVAFRGWDDDFDTDNGFSGKVQYGLVIRDPRIADVSQSNSFESDNCADGATVSPYTTAVFSNITMVGPIGQDANFVNDAAYINGGSVYPNNGSSLGKFQAAMHIRRSSRLSCFNSVAIGYPIGLILDSEKGNTQSVAGTEMFLQNIWFSDMALLGSDANKKYQDNLYDYASKTFDMTKPSFSHTFFESESSNKVVKSSDLMLTGKSLAGANFMPQAGSPLLSAASFVNPLLGIGFEQVGFIGAFGTGSNWLDGWTEFDPQNAKY